MKNDSRHKEQTSLFVVRFTDHPDQLAIRREFMDAHLQWLRTHHKQVLVAGSLRIDPAENPLGACWIVRARSRTDVETLLMTDPFWTQGLRASHEIHFWSKAFPDTTTLV